LPWKSSLSLQVQGSNQDCNSQMAQNSLKRRHFSQVALMERVVNSQNLGYENERQVQGVGYKEESTEGAIHRWALKEGSE
jgi:hypothetical protein